MIHIPQHVIHTAGVKARGHVPRLRMAAKGRGGGASAVLHVSVTFSYYSRTTILIQPQSVSHTSRYERVKQTERPQTDLTLEWLSPYFFGRARPHTSLSNDRTYKLPFPSLSEELRWK